MKKNIKSNELMIGDWVFAYSRPRQVEIIYDEGIQAHCIEFSEGEFDPIPLTPEILEKNFESNDNNFGYQNYTLNANFIIENRGDRFCLVRIVEGYHYATFFICNIKYVHQLQHAIKLLGIDKEIVL